MINPEKKIILGVMSGTSLDGLDIALCSFIKSDMKYNYEIIKAHTYSYPSQIREKLESAHLLNSFDFILFHKEYGSYIGERINDFLSGVNSLPEFIGSHGHTVFHQPDRGITFQIGDGAAISAKTGINVISDFRNTDVCLGGQGAPLVPIGDKLLFPEYDYCLNIGGFANISVQNGSNIVAYDICPANIVLNRYAKFFGKEYDEDGEIGRRGKIDLNLLETLNSISYYNVTGPKSLGREWLDEVFISKLNVQLSNEDILRSLYEHIAIQISSNFSVKESKILITGGGARNKFLIELIRARSKSQIIIPDGELVDYKEALIFGFMAYLNSERQINCMASVTGADYDNIGGALNYGKP